MAAGISQVVAIPQFPVVVPLLVSAVPVQAVDAQLPANDGNLELPPPSYDEVMANLSQPVMVNLDLLRFSRAVSTNVLLENIDVAVLCRFGNGRSCPECRERGAPSTSGQASAS